MTSYPFNWEFLLFQWTELPGFNGATGCDRFATQMSHYLGLWMRWWNRASWRRRRRLCCKYFMCLYISSLFEFFVLPLTQGGFQCNWNPFQQGSSLYQTKCVSVCHQSTYYIGYVFIFMTQRELSARNIKWRSDEFFTWCGGLLSSNRVCLLLYLRGASVSFIYCVGKKMK